ncbi:hypothetical protein ANANG_G00095820, partial [Anguilla anguilla]
MFITRKHCVRLLKFGGAPADSRTRAGLEPASAGEILSEPGPGSAYNKGKVNPVSTQEELTRMPSKEKTRGLVPREIMERASDLEVNESMLFE